MNTDTHSKIAEDPRVVKTLETADMLDVLSSMEWVDNRIEFYEKCVRELEVAMGQHKLGTSSCGKGEECEGFELAKVELPAMCEAIEDLRQLRELHLKRLSEFETDC